MFAPGSAFACVRLCTWRVSSNDALLIQVADVYLRVSLRDIQGSVVPAQANLFPPRACCRWVSVSEIGSTYSKDVAVFAGPGWCHVGRNAAINLWPEVWLSFLCLDMVGMRLATSTRWRGGSETEIHRASGTMGEVSSLFSDPESW